MEHFLGWRMEIQSQHNNRLSVALFRATLKVIIVMCFGLAALGYVFEHELSQYFYAMFLTVVVAMAAGVIIAVVTYRADARASKVIFERDLRIFDTEFYQKDTEI